MFARYQYEVSVYTRKRNIFNNKENKIIIKDLKRLTTFGRKKSYWQVFNDNCYIIQYEIMWIIEVLKKAKLEFCAFYRGKVSKKTCIAYFIGDQVRLCL